MRLALVGLPGSGKTTAGRQIARRLLLSFIDSDHVIEERIGGSIKDFFAREGEAAFRDVEADVISQLAQGEPCVLATGGGAVLRAANREVLRAHCQVVYLHSTPEEVWRRVRHDDKRPLLQVEDPLARIRELFAARDPLYRETAHYTIETGHTSVAMLTSKVLMQLELAGAVPPRRP
jgi:shikimate kinase